MRYNIVIADDEPITRMDIKELLEEEGYNVVGEVSDGFDVIEICRKNKPDLVLMDIKMPILDGIKASRVIFNENTAKSIMLLTAYSGIEFIEQAKEVGVMGYVVKPISKPSLIPAIEVAIAKGREFEEMKKEIILIKSKLEARKIIEKAKGILMENEKISEDRAYKKIKKLSMDKRFPMEDIASAIIMSVG